VIIVTGHLVVDPDSRSRVVEDSAEAVRLARATDGCLDFAVSADSVDPARVNIAERWVDRASLDTFRGSGPEGDEFAAVREFAVSEYDVPGA
jgi:quinol monooxygenase YgiN